MARSEASYTCSYCNHESAHVIAGPTVYICFSCATAYTEALKQSPVSTASQQTAQPTCSFCGRLEPAVQRVLPGASASICNECLRLCNDIMGRPFA